MIISNKQLWELGKPRREAMIELMRLRYDEQFRTTTETDQYIDQFVRNRFMKYYQFGFRKPKSFLSLFGLDCDYHWSSIPESENTKYISILSARLSEEAKVVLVRRVLHEAHDIDN